MFDRYRADLAKNLLKLKLDLRGPMKLLGHYQVNGQVLILPISGDGPCNLTLSKHCA